LLILAIKNIVLQQQFSIAMYWEKSIRSWDTKKPNNTNCYLVIFCFRINLKLAKIIISNKVGKKLLFCKRLKLSLKCNCREILQTGKFDILNLACSSFNLENAMHIKKGHLTNLTGVSWNKNTSNYGKIFMPFVCFSYTNAGNILLSHITTSITRYFII
jgi:hypothetical protein